MPRVIKMIQFIYCIKDTQYELTISAVKNYLQKDIKYDFKKYEKI